MMAVDDVEFYVQAGVENMRTSYVDEEYCPLARMLALTQTLRIHCWILYHILV